MNTKILNTTTYFPEYSYSSEEVRPYFNNWLENTDSKTHRLGMSIFSHSPIKNRHTIAPIDVIFSKRDLTETNQLYKKQAIHYSEQALKKAFLESKITPQEIDFIITTSCTGFMIPSIDAYLIEKFNFRPDLKRLPVTEMGCNAGVSALIYANDYLKAYPAHKVCILNLEFPSNTVQLGDFSIENIVGTCLFADGLSVTFLTGEDEGKLEIVDTHMQQISNSLDLLGYNLTNTGLKMNLSAELPNLIESNFLEVVEPFLLKNGLQIEDIDNFLIHPGGFKIIDKIEGALKGFNKNLSESRKVMLESGNLSSATIIHILDDYLQNKNKTNQNILLMGFGPGFSAHIALLKG